MRKSTRFHSQHESFKIMSIEGIEMAIKLSPLSLVFSSMIQIGQIYNTVGFMYLQFFSYTQSINLAFILYIESFVLALLLLPILILAKRSFIGRQINILIGNNFFNHFFNFRFLFLQSFLIAYALVVITPSYFIFRIPDNLESFNKLCQYRNNSCIQYFNDEFIFLKNKDGLMEIRDWHDVSQQ